MNVILGIVFILAVVVASGASTVVIFRRQQKARNLHPPEKLRFRRGPGESLRRRSEKLGDRFVNTVIIGSIASISLFQIPIGILLIRPEANPLILLGSSVALFLAGLTVSVRRSVKLLQENACLTLGRIGELVVAEALEKTLVAGCRVFHDVPTFGEWGEANIDHVVVGPHGVAVVETKMRSKPSDKAPWENRVTYDGEKLAWPRFPNDTATLWQVRKNAEWLEGYLLDKCGLAIPVRQVVAIPGWKVDEKVLGQPRVVKGEGAGDAVLQALGTKMEPRFTSDQVKRLVAAMDALCRDVEI
jgi:hypothetical protein